MTPYWGETMVNFGRDLPKEWDCPRCKRHNRRYYAKCPKCGTNRPAEFSGRPRPGIVNLASHNEADGRI